MIDFSISPDLEAARQSVTAFMEQHVCPNEEKLVEDEVYQLSSKKNCTRR